MRLYINLENDIQLHKNQLMRLVYRAREQAL